MDLIDYWIWEHASKYGMTQILKGLKSKYIEIDLPCSWLGALLLNQVKKDWITPEKRDYKTLISVHEVLASTIKFYSRELKRQIDIVKYIKIILNCRAVTMILRRSSASNLSHGSLWKRAVDELFPIWNTQVWNRIKNMYNLKSSVEEDICRIHVELRQKLLQNNTLQEKDILDSFQEDINQYFPIIKEFLYQLNLSTLEKVLVKNAKLSSHVEFMREFLKDGITENSLLKLMKENDVRRVKMKCQKFLGKVNKSVKEDDVEHSIMNAEIYTLLSNSSRLQDDESCFTYPPCTNQHTHVPSNITLESNGVFKEYAVNKSPPLITKERTFEPYWFCEIGEINRPIHLRQVKEEKKENRIGKEPNVPIQNATYTVPRALEQPALVSTPKKQVLNRLSLTKSGSPRQTKVANAANFCINLGDEKLPSTPTHSKHETSSAPSTSSSTDSGCRILIGSYDKASPGPVTLTVRKTNDEGDLPKIVEESKSVEKERNKDETISSEALKVSPNFGRKQLPAEDNTSKRKILRSDSINCASSGSSSPEKSPNKANVSSSVSQDEAHPHEIKSISDATSVRKLRSGKIVDNRHENKNSKNESPTVYVRQKPCPASKKRVACYSLRQPFGDASDDTVKSHRSYVEDRDSDSEFQPLKKKSAKKPESDAETHRPDKVEYEVHSESPGRRSNASRSPAKKSSGATRQEVKQTRSAGSVSSPEKMADPPAASKPRASKRKLDMEHDARSLQSESPRSKRQYVPVDVMLDRSRVFPKLLDTLQQNVLRLKCRPETARHAEMLSKCVGRLLRSHKRKNEELHLSGDIADRVKKLNRVKTRANKI